MRRSLRLQSRTTVCPAHYHQADNDDSMALCGLLSFNNLYHAPILAYEDCQKVARKWVGANSDSDKRLTTIADNQGRGAFSIQILKVALEKQGYKVFNITKQTNPTTRLEALACKFQPCVLLCGNNQSTTAHAVAICSFGHLHDPDYDYPHKLSVNNKLMDLEAWMAANDLTILNIYKAIRHEPMIHKIKKSSADKATYNTTLTCKKPKLGRTRRTRRGRKHRSTSRNKKSIHQT